MTDELDSIWLELGRLGIHFALFRNSLPPGDLKSFDAALRAYGKALDRLQILIGGLRKQHSLKSPFRRRDGR